MRDPEGNRQGYLLACEDITVKESTRAGNY